MKINISSVPHFYKWRQLRITKVNRLTSRKATFLSLSSTQIHPQAYSAQNSSRTSSFSFQVVFAELHFGFQWRPKCQSHALWYLLASYIRAVHKDGLQKCSFINPEALICRRLNMYACAGKMKKQPLCTYPEPVATTTSLLGGRGESLLADAR